MHVPKAICCECLVAMRCEKNGVTVEMLTKDGEGALQSYYKISSDRWECPKCGVKILTGFASQAFSEYWHDNYERCPTDVQAEF